MRRTGQAVKTGRAGPLAWGRTLPGAKRWGWPCPGPRLAPGHGLAAWRAWLLGSRRARLIALAIIGLCLLLGGAWLWFRDSSFVTVQKVSVSGESGPDAGAIRSALVGAARSMTTLDVQTGRLYAAVSAFPVVKELSVSTQFPHGMRIHVIEQLPVATVVLGGRRVAVAADGTLIHDLSTIPILPRLELSVPPGGPRLSDPRALESLAAASQAPRPFLSRISLISVLHGHGVVARLRDGPVIYLGDASRLKAKWAATVAVLADAGSQGASYIDVTDPSRPAAGST